MAKIKVTSDAQAAAGRVALRTLKLNGLGGTWTLRFSPAKKSIGILDFGKRTLSLSRTLVDALPLTLLTRAINTLVGRAVVGPESRYSRRTGGYLHVNRWSLAYEGESTLRDLGASWTETGALDTTVTTAVLDAAPWTARCSCGAVHPIWALTAKRRAAAPGATPCPDSYWHHLTEYVPREQRTLIVVDEVPEGWGEIWAPSLAA